MDTQGSVFVLGNHVQACCWHMDRLPRAGETFQANSLTIEPGGKGLNVALGLHRLGQHVHLVLGCGRDAAGDAVVQLLREEGLDLSGVFRFDGMSGWGAGFIAADGHNAIAVYPGANLLLRAEHVCAVEASLMASDLVYGQFETSIEAVEQAFAMAHGRGICTVLNPSPWQPVPERIRAATRVIIANEGEAAGLLALSPLCTQTVADWALVQDWLRAGVADVWVQWPALEVLVVTLGGLGACVWPRPAHGGRSEAIFMPSLPVEALDTVGAGDAFATGWLVRWLSLGKPDWHSCGVIEQCLRFGHIMGAHMVGTVGVLQGLPSQSTLAAVQTALCTAAPQCFSEASGGIGSQPA
ncbi:PfkB family carbohydrate kinase [Hydrogenophaga electricum]|uniref:Ribokinase n=1 Tax=Hydrogenophaga electricum TaxID=1230953 RepID=A0ABQ6C934_9BURK|nr:PfkB family carbohydrate kinase [Hydrogenophaga electricum]GLS14742.1 ribokinase [Hydrogenophaga electricum]